MNDLQHVQPHNMREAVALLIDAQMNEAFLDKKHFKLSRSKLREGLIGSAVQVMDLTSQIILSQIKDIALRDKIRKEVFGA